MKKTVTFLIFILLFFQAYSQSGTITNISVQPRNNGSGMVDVYFDLSGEAFSYNILIEVSFDAGANYKPIPASLLGGDLTAISPGSRHVVWDGYGSFPNKYSNKTMLKILATNFGVSVPCPNIPTFIDPRDDNTYFTVQIGEQCWMKENLRYLPEVYPPSDGSFSDPYYYVYGFDGFDVNNAILNENYQNYGVLYNWPSSLTACPSGWKLPSMSDWQVLLNTINNEGSNDLKGNVLKSCRQVNSPLGGYCDTDIHPRWNENLTNANFGTDNFGYKAMPGGMRMVPHKEEKYGFFDYLGEAGYWWSSDADQWGHGYHIFIYLESAAVHSSFGLSFGGFSVRCIYDN